MLGGKEEQNSGTCAVSTWSETEWAPIIPGNNLSHQFPNSVTTVSVSRRGKGEGSNNHTADRDTWIF